MKKREMGKREMGRRNGVSVNGETFQCSVCDMSRVDTEYDMLSSFFVHRSSSVPPLSREEHGTDTDSTKKEM